MYFERNRQSMINVYFGIPIALLGAGIDIGVRGTFAGWW